MSSLSAQGPSVSIPTHRDEGLSTPLLTPFDSPHPDVRRFARTLDPHQARSQGGWDRVEWKLLEHVQTPRVLQARLCAPAGDPALSWAQFTVQFKVRSISHWSPYDRVGVVNADP